MLHALEAETGKSFLFEGSEGLTLDHFAITFKGTRAEVEERALPFRQGDEVLVEIVEPHMYDVDDAVAKIDGYIISIAGAAPLVGEKRMVRIDQVGRTAASALLLDEAGEVVVAPRPRHACAQTARRAASLAGRGRRRPRRASGARSADAGAARRPTARTPKPAGKPGCTVRDGERGRARGRRGAPEPVSATPATSRRALGEQARDGEDAGRARPPRMAYNPSLGVVAAEADGAVRLPRPRPPSSGHRRPASDERD